MIIAQPNNPSKKNFKKDQGSKSKIPRLSSSISSDDVENDAANKDINQASKKQKSHGAKRKTRISNDEVFQPEGSNTKCIFLII